MPGPDVIAVVALARLAGGRAEVGEVALRTGRLVVVVAGRRHRPIPVPAPGRVIALTKLGGRARGVDVVAEREHGAIDRREQVGRRAVLGRTATGDVTGADHDRVGREDWRRSPSEPECESDHQDPDRWSGHSPVHDLIKPRATTVARVPGVASTRSRWPSAVISVGRSCPDCGSVDSPRNASSPRKPAAARRQKIWNWWRWGRVELPVQNPSPETTTSVSDGLSSTARTNIGTLPGGPVTCP